MRFPENDCGIKSSPSGGTLPSWLCVAVDFLTFFFLAERWGKNPMDPPLRNKWISYRWGIFNIETWIEIHIFPTLLCWSPSTPLSLFLAEKDKKPSPQAVEPSMLSSSPRYMIIAMPMQQQGWGNQQNQSNGQPGAWSARNQGQKPHNEARFFSRRLKKNPVCFVVLF